MKIPKTITVVDYQSAVEFDKVKAADPEDHYGGWTFQEFRENLDACCKQAAEDGLNITRIELTFDQIEHFCQSNGLVNNSRSRAQMATELRSTHAT